MDSSLYYIIIIATFVVFFLTFLIIYQAVFLNKRKQFFRHEILRTQIEIQEQTFREISSELHDNLGQIASLIKINLNTLKFDDLIKAGEKINDTKELTRQLILDIKTISVSLGSDRITQFGLVRVLEEEVARLNRIGQFSATMEKEGVLPVMEYGKAIVLYRMAQEILNNTIKHSGAKQITISLNTTGNLFTLALSDDGIGFNPEEKMKSGGAGLMNLQNRARLIKAQLMMQSTPGEGTKVKIELPI